VKRVLRSFALVLLVFSLAACTAHGNMYNLSTGEKTTFSYSYNGGGRGKMTGTFASGEAATGEYSVITGGSVAWGTVYASVYGPNGSAYGSGNAVSVRRNGRREGSAILVGSNGTVITCEFDLGLSGHGFGACKSNAGALYKLLF
jgi:hypothetical protein